jgi:hypothetical protein
MLLAQIRREQLQQEQMTVRNSWSFLDNLQGMRSVQCTNTDSE